MAQIAMRALRPLLFIAAFLILQHAASFTRAAAGADQQMPYPPTATPSSADVSGFDDFSFERHGDFGFCPRFDRFFSASIHARSGGAYGLTMSLLRRGTVGIDPCLERCCGIDDCAVVVPLPERDLRADEIARMRTLFSNVQYFAERDASDENVVCDYCLINSARWDEFASSDLFCSRQPRVLYGQMDAIEVFLESLRPDYTPPPTRTATPSPTPFSPEPTSTYLPEPLLVFGFSIEPAHPVVGDHVELVVTVANTRGFAGQPQFGLSGYREVFATPPPPAIEPSPVSVLAAATLTYDLVAERAGTAELSLNAIYEICVGGPGLQPCYRGSSTSEVFSVEIGEAATPVPSATQPTTPTRTAAALPTPTATPRPAATPSSTAGTSSGSGCSMHAVEHGGSSPLVPLGLTVLATIRRRRRRHPS